MAAALACRLAERGVTGPAEPFTGRNGLLGVVFPTTAPRLFVSRGDSGIAQARVKLYPACYWSQSAIAAAVQLRAMVRDIEDVRTIQVSTWHKAWLSIGGGAGDDEIKRHPRTRETADHSLAYLVTSALRDGRIDADTFADKRLADTELSAVLDRVFVSEDESFSRLVDADPESQPCRVRVTLHGGRVFEQTLTEPPITRTNPASDADLDRKFRAQVTRVLSPRDAAQLRDGLWNLDGEPSLDAIAALLRRFKATPERGTPSNTVAIGLHSLT